MTIDKKLEEELRKIHIPTVEEIMSGSRSPGLDKEPWMEGIEPFLTQDDWIPKYNEAGKVMACAADYYRAAKHGEKVLESVQEHFEILGVITSTEIIFNKKNLEGKIVHYIGSKVVKPVERKLLIPFYSGNLAENILGTKEGLKFMQGLFLTDDGKEEILETLEILSNMKEDKLNIWTPSQGGRKRRETLPLRSVSLDYNDGVFRVGAYDNAFTIGRSRAVSNPIQ